MNELVSLFVKAALLAVFMTSLTPLKRSDKRSYAIIAAGNIFIWLLNFLIYAIKDVAFLERAIILSTIVPAFIFFSAVAKYKGFKVLFSLLTVSIFGMMCGFAGAMAKLAFNSELIGALCNTFCYALIIVFIFKVFRKPYFRMLEMLESGWGLFCSVPFLLLLIIFLLQYYPVSIESRPKDGPLLCLVYILMFVFYVIIYLNFENITQYYQLKNSKRLMLLQAEMQKKEFEAIRDKISAIQIYRHDTRHHINVLSGMLSENNLVEAEKYLGRLSERMGRTVIEKYCDNYVVNVILSSYISKAREENIEVTCRADIPASIKTDDLELGTIFANAVENAINACRQIESTENRRISIDCREHYGQLYIQICNTFAGEVVFDGEYPVSHGEDHGFGTRSIAAIAEKYGGVFSFAVEENLFKATVILNDCI